MKRCECCDHPLQHAIRAVIARYEAPIPPPTHEGTIRALRQALDDFEDEADYKNFVRAFTENKHGELP